MILSFHVTVRYPVPVAIINLPASRMSIMHIVMVSKVAQAHAIHLP